MSDEKMRMLGWGAATLFFAALSIAVWVQPPDGGGRRFFVPVICLVFAWRSIKAYRGTRDA